MNLKVFANPEVVARDWYTVGSSKSLNAGEVKSVQLGKKKLALYRDVDGVAHVMDSRCPHLGADLSLGVVIGDRLQCPFHNWEIGSDGRCLHAPALPETPNRKVRTYPVCEQWGLIWMYNAVKVERSLPQIDPDLRGRWLTFPVQKITTHPHLVIGNGLDFEHMGPLHGLDLLKEPEFHVDGTEIRGEFLLKFRRRHIRWLTGTNTKEIFASFTTHGSSIALAETKGRVRSQTLFTGRPDEKGNCHTRTLIFLPSWRPDHVFYAVSSMFYLLKDDRTLLDNLEFQPGFTEQDWPMKKFASVVEGLGVW